jgi:uncharacterized protein
LGYLPRVVDDELRRRLAAAGAVVIEGPKASGKTETALKVTASSAFFDVDSSVRQALAIDPSLVLEGATPRLLDEWQVEPSIWNHVRRAVDERKRPAQFILTGSSVPVDDVNRHTGAGRFSFLRIRPMTLFETGHSIGTISLAAVMRGETVRSVDPLLTVPDLADRITIGGWPGQVGSTIANGAQAARDYLQQTAEVDIIRAAGGRRDPVRVGRLLRSLARNIATEVGVPTLAADAGGADGPLSRNTASDYLDALERLMIIENQPAWGPHLRSKAILRSAPKRHFADPSLAVAALATSPQGLLADLNLLGLLFESLVIRDLRVFAQPLDGTVSHYRDSNGLEVDAIIQLADGRWAAFEVKLGSGMIDAGAATLKRFAATVDTEQSGQPAALAVITGNGFGYMRDDGVAVIPIGALAP